MRKRCILKRNADLTMEFHIPSSFCETSRFELGQIQRKTDALVVGIEFLRFGLKEIKDLSDVSIGEMDFIDDD